jgi:hypothetical protein
MSIEVGDEVVITSLFEEKVGEVIRITPTGIIVVKDCYDSEMKFNPNGFQRGNKDSYHRWRIYKNEQKMKEAKIKYLLRDIIYTLRYKNPETWLSYDNVVAIQKLLAKPKEPVKLTL